MRHQRPQPRGFAILIILAVVATASVIITVQLASTEGQAGSQIRTTEALKARAAAERCVEAADAYVQGIGNADQAADFDRILDPDGSIDVTGGGDDFLPPAGIITAATISTMSIPPGAGDAFHRYRVFVLDGQTACAVRYDDNSDDTNGNLDPSLDDVGVEGPGVPNDVPSRDRDRTLITTAVGFMFVAGTPVTSMVEKAHATASVKRVRAMPNNSGEGLAIHAGGSANIDGGSICGDIGGITADAINGSGLCVCGVLNAELPLSGVNQGNQSTPCPDCTNCANNGGSTTSAGPRANPTITIPPRPGWMANQLIGEPESSGNDIAAGACKIYFRDGASSQAGTAPAIADIAGTDLSSQEQVFLWDKNDTTSLASAQAAVGGPANVIGGVSEDCTTNTSDPLPKPCSWDIDPTTGAPGRIRCDFGESLCWKLIAHLEDGAQAADLDPARGGNQSEQTNNSGDNWSPRGGSIPNLVGLAAPTWNSYCGGCTSCSTGGNFVDGTSDGFELKGTWSTTNMPSPAYFFFETATPEAATASNAVTSPELKISIGTNATARIALFTNGGALIDGSSKWCNPLSTCAQGDVTAIDRNNCDVDDTNVLAIEPKGFALFTGGNLKTASNKVDGIMGRVDTGTLDSNGQDCWVGDVVAHDPALGVLDCGDADPVCAAGGTICFKNGGTVVGDVIADGNICMKNGFNFAGVMETNSNVAWKNNGALEGQIKAGLNVIGKNNNTISFDGSGASATTGSPSAMWMEGTW